jgi:hypothetical protein
MPNGHDKNWMRLRSLVQAFHTRYGHWPTTVRVIPGTVEEMRRVLDPATAVEAIAEKVRIIESGDGFTAEDNSENRLSYGEALDDQRPSSVSAESWLGVVSRPHDISDEYTFTSPSAAPPRALNRPSGHFNFVPIAYATLNARQKENFNFQKISAVLSDFGYVTIRLSDDWNGADFIALHVDGVTVLRVQLKGRLTFRKEYFGKELAIAFFESGHWYLYPHDALASEAAGPSNYQSTKSWTMRGGYSFPKVPTSLQDALERYKIPRTVAPEDRPILTDEQSEDE